MTEERLVDKMTYEEAFAELEGLVNKLEEGDLQLEESLATFERGQALADRCSELLEKAELKLRQLVQDESGGLVETEFQPEES